jgi:hypothetical protein
MLNRLKKVNAVEGSNIGPGLTLKVLDDVDVDFDFDPGSCGSAPASDSLLWL